MTAPPVALVVDDEPQMIEIVAFALETQGFRTLTVGSAEAAWTVLREQKVDLIILDVMLPHVSGLTLCRRIRETSDVPIILLTARGDSSDRVSGLEFGADDYVTKPFHPRELALRAEAIVRRTRPRDSHGLREFGPVRMTSDQATVGDRILVLSPTERGLLEALLQAEGGTVSFDDLLLAGWQQVPGPGGRQMLKTAIYRLRARLADCGYENAIVGVRAEGYRLRAVS